MDPGSVGGVVVDRHDHAAGRSDQRFEAGQRSIALLLPSSPWDFRCSDLEGEKRFANIVQPVERQRDAKNPDMPSRGRAYDGSDDRSSHRMAR